MDQILTLLGCQVQHDTPSPTAEQIVIELYARLDETKGLPFLTEQMARKGWSPLSLKITGDPWSSRETGEGAAFSLALEALQVLERFLIPLFTGRYKRTPWSPLVHVMLQILACKMERDLGDVMALLTQPVGFDGGRKQQQLIHTLLGHLAALPISQLSLADVTIEARCWSQLVRRVDVLWLRDLLLEHLNHGLLKSLLPGLSHPRTAESLRDLARLIDVYRCPVLVDGPDLKKKAVASFFYGRFFFPCYAHLKAWQSRHATDPLMRHADLYPRYFLALATLFLDVVGQPLTGRYLAWLLAFWDAQLLRLDLPPDGPSSAPSAASQPPLSLRPNYLLSLLLSLLPTLPQSPLRVQIELTARYTAYLVTLYQQPPKPQPAALPAPGPSTTLPAPGPSTTLPAPGPSAPSVLAASPTMIRPELKALLEALSFSRTYPALADFERLQANALFMPKFSLSFVSLQDYLIRNFVLFRASIWAAILHDIVSPVPSVACCYPLADDGLQLQAGAREATCRLTLPAEEASSDADDRNRTLILLRFVDDTSIPKQIARLYPTRSLRVVQQPAPTKQSISLSFQVPLDAPDFMPNDWSHVHLVHPATAVSFDVMDALRSLFYDSLDHHHSIFPDWLVKSLLGHLSPAGLRLHNARLEPDSFPFSQQLIVASFIQDEVECRALLESLGVEHMTLPATIPSSSTSTTPRTAAHVTSGQLSVTFKEIGRTIRFSWAPETPHQDTARFLHFYPAQKRAILSTLTQRVTLIQGPPGTGKTTVASALLRVLYHNFASARQPAADWQRLLIMAHSNLALDELVARLADLPLLRLGSRCGHPEAQSKTVRGHLDRQLQALQTELSRYPEVASRVVIKPDDLRHVFSQVQAALVRHGANVPAATQQWLLQTAQRLAQPFRGFERTLLLSSPIIAVTCGALNKYRQLLQEAQVKILLLDEAGKVLETETLLALFPQLNRLVMVGDARQLSSVLKDEALRVHASYDQSMFERLERNGIPVVCLDQQARARAPLADLYRGLYPALTDLPGSTAQLTAKLASLGLMALEKPVWVPVAPDGGARGETSSGEAKAIEEIVRGWRQRGVAAAAITVLTPYRAQKRLLAQRMKEAGVEVSTTDEFQGKENDFIIISLVATGKAPSLHMRNLKRVCVLTSRARLALCLVGHHPTFNHCQEWQAVIQHTQLLSSLNQCFESSSTLSSSTLSSSTHSNQIEDMMTHLAKLSIIDD